jgi:hypothetical protein
MLIHAGHSIQRSGSKFVVQPYGREFSQLSSAKAWLGRHVKREMTKPTRNPGKVLREGEMLIHAGHAIERVGTKFVVRPYGREFTKLASAKAWLGRHVKREMTKPTRNPLALRTNGKGRPRGQVYRGLRVLSCGGVYIVEAYKEPFKTAAEARAWIDDQLGSAPVRRASKQIDVSANRPFPLSLFTANPRR